MADDDLPHSSLYLGPYEEQAPRDVDHEPVFVVCGEQVVIGLDSFVTGAFHFLRRHLQRDAQDFQADIEAIDVFAQFELLFVK